ncbi:MAG: transposase [Sandaracinaceae bacterium]
MTQSRYIEPGAVYAITRRTERRRFLLRPDALMTQLFTWLLCVMAARFEIEVHVAVVMSTHYHLVVTDPHGRVSKFAEGLNGLLSKAIKVLRRGVRGVVWEPGKLSIVALVTREAVVESIAYAIANPVAAGLVTDPAHWPGLTASVDELGTRVLEAKRPGFFFRPKKWVEMATRKLVWPACLAELGVETARALVRAELAGQLERAHAAVRASGRRVLGPVAARNEGPLREAVSQETAGSLNPRVKAGRGQTEARMAALTKRAVFRQDYAAALSLWCAGDRQVVFPAGTYWMRVHHGAAMAAFET